MASIISRFGLGPLADSSAKMRLNNAQPAPADEAVIDDLVRAMDLGRVAPARAVPDHDDYARDHPPVVHTGHPVRQRKIGFDPAQLLVRQQARRSTAI